MALQFQEPLEAAAPAPAGKPDDPPELWARFRDDRDPIARDLLIRHYLPFARMIAAITYGRRTHDDVGFDDYLQLASLGLLDAVDRFDPAVGVLFRTFAAKRVQGAVLSGLTRLTEKNQQIALGMRLRRDRIESLKQSDPLPDDAGAAEATPGPTGQDDLFRYLAEVGVGLALGVLLEGSGMVDAEAFDGEARAVSPEVSYFRQTELRQLRQLVGDLVGSLSPQQQRVIRYHYLQEIPFENIARTMGLTRGRVSQLHRAALLRLRELLPKDRHLDVSL